MQAQELLSNIASLEMTVSRLEEEMISLHFQLIQERNERRLAEYQLKQLPVQTKKSCSTKDLKNVITFPCFHQHHCSHLLIIGYLASLNFLG